MFDELLEEIKRAYSISEVLRIYKRLGEKIENATELQRAEILRIFKAEIEGHANLDSAERFYDQYKSSSWWDEDFNDIAEVALSKKLEDEISDSINLKCLSDVPNLFETHKAKPWLKYESQKRIKELLLKNLNPSFTPNGPEPITDYSSHTGSFFFSRRRIVGLVKESRARREANRGKIPTARAKIASTPKEIPNAKTGKIDSSHTKPTI